MQYTITKISDIKPNPNNPRTIKDAKFRLLVQSVNDFPKMLEIRPIVVNDDMVVLGGNMRLKACKEAGLKEVPVIRASDLTETEQREFIIKDNVGFGEWDMEALANEWERDELEKWGLDLEFEEVPEQGVKEDDYEIPDEIHTDIKAGDVFVLTGEKCVHTLFCGSSTEESSLKAVLGNSKADMVFTDPPYLMNFQ
jgi:hypothetical protein